MARDIPIKTPDSLEQFMGLAEYLRHKGLLEMGLVALVARGQDLNQPLAGGPPPMHRALAVGKAWLVEAMLAAGADPMARHDGVPAFRAAVAWNETAAVVAMVQSGRVEINHVDDVGATAFHDAASNGNVVIMKLLLAHGATALTPDRQGETGLERFRRLHARHLVPRWAELADRTLSELEPAARLNGLETALGPPSPPLPRPRL